MKKLSAFILIAFIALNVQSQTKSISLEDAVLQQYRNFYPENTLMVQWIPDTKDYSFLSSNYQTLRRSNSKKTSISDILSVTELNEMTGEKFSYVNVISWYDADNFYTSVGGKYFLINVDKKTAKQLGELPENAENGDLCVANNSVAYTIDNNLYIQSSDNKQTQVTNLNDQIVSGQAIARSEFGITVGIFWSNSGENLAFYQKDESDVADYPLLDITTPTGSLRSLKYPMAGQGSEKSAVGIYNSETGQTVYIKPQGDQDDYLTNLSWSIDDKYVYIAEVNRGQNHMYLRKYDANTGELVQTLFEEKSKKWVEPEHPAFFISNSQFLWMSERDGFMNIYLYSTEGKLVKQLTKNKWVAQEILGSDGNGNIFFKGTGVDPRERKYFRVNINTGVQDDLTREVGSHNVIFSNDFAYYFDKYSSFEVPNKELVKETGKMKVLKEVMTASNPYKKHIMGKAEYGTIKSDDDKTDLYYRLIKPSDFDESKKYPVLVYVYGGPHAQMVTNSWLGGANLWMYWLAEQGYLVYTVDNRGSENRGFEFETVIHRQVGTPEMADQMKGVEFLKSLPYVDGDRLAVHGWSYGGFMTTSLMLRNAGTFNVGVAGGPVTDWSYYEVMYGERYMDRPEENEDGYKANRLMNYVNKLKGDLLLIHGTIDDVVVMQHNLALVKAFVDAGIQMDFFPYPMHPHNVRGKDRVHLMTKVLNYIIKNNE